MEVVDYLMNVYIDVPVKEWGTILEEADFPTLARCMSGMFSTILTLLFPERFQFFVNVLVRTLMDFFGWM